MRNVEKVVKTAKYNNSNIITIKLPGKLDKNTRSGYYIIHKELAIPRNLHTWIIGFPWKPNRFYNLGNSNGKDISKTGLRLEITTNLYTKKNLDQ